MEEIKKDEDQTEKANQVFTRSRPGRLQLQGKMNPQSFESVSKQCNYTLPLTTEEKRIIDAERFSMGNKANSFRREFHEREETFCRVTSDLNKLCQISNALSKSSVSERHTGNGNAKLKVDWSNTPIMIIGSNFNHAHNNKDNYLDVKHRVHGKKIKA